MLLPGKSHGQRSLIGYSPWGHKESDTTERLHSLIVNMGSPSGSSGKEPACNAGDVKRHRFDPWIGKIPWGRAWQRTPVFLPGDSHRQKSLAGHKESDRTAATEHTHTHISLESPIFILSIIPAVTTRGQIEMHVGVAVVPQQRHLGLSPRCLGQVPRVLAPVRV